MSAEGPKPPIDLDEVDIAITEHGAPDKPPPEPLTGTDMALRLLLLVAVLYFFLLGISLMGSSFKLIGGGTVGAVFQAIHHPIAALMVGMMGTALIQSSSTTTSIIVALVAGGAVDVGNAIPMVMGANIGTSVTNTLVSMGHAGDREEFKRAFAGATVHDFFNILAVLVLLPLEIATGMIEKASHALTQTLAGVGGGKMGSPLKVILKPVESLIIQVDKAKIKASAAGEAIDGSLIKGGIFHDAGLADSVVGLIILVAAGGLIIGSLVVIVKLMKSLMEAKAAQYLKKALEANAYAAMGIGVLVTVMVQSSSITTSTLVPLVGIGLISLEAIFPLTLGANIGTTVTALIASMASDSDTGLQIALCHLLFNIIGILIWFPIPFMRNVPLSMARKLGEIVAERRYMAVVYIAVVFFIIPFGILAIDRLLIGG